MNIKKEEAENMATEKVHRLEEVFCRDYNEYKVFKLMALAEFQDMIKGRTPSLKKVIPERIKVEFNKSIKSVEIYMPRYTGKIIVEYPDNKLTIPQKTALRHKLTMLYGSLIKVNEDIMSDEWAMKMKLLGKKPPKVARK